MQISTAFLCLLLGLLVRAQHDESEQKRTAAGDNRPLLPPIRPKNPFQTNGNYYIYQLQQQHQQQQQQRTGPPNGSPQMIYYVSLADYAGAMQQYQPPMAPGMGFGPQMQLPYYPPMSLMPPYAKQGYPVVPLTFQRGGQQLPKDPMGQDDDLNDEEAHNPSQQPNVNAADKEESPADQSDASESSSPASPTRSASSPMFTNAHHYPFPQGLMQMYYQNYYTNPSSSGGEQGKRPLNNPSPQLPIVYLYPSGSPYLSPSGEPLQPPVGHPGLGSNQKSSAVGPSSDGKPQPGTNEGSSAKQTGKTSGSDYDDDSPATPVKIYKYPMPGFSHLGDMYVPVYASERGSSSKSRV